MCQGFFFPEGFQTVQTKYGEIQGVLTTINFQNRHFQVKKFLGIPYAEPPTGELRFRKSLPIRSMPSPLKATAYGPKCPQRNIRNVTQSEDCLYLNVYVPTNSGAELTKKPVMIWIHGGGFAIGAANNYDAGTLSAFTDVIIVTINYRLGALGFFSTNDKEAAGNYGLWDQQLAIRWVHDNIESFGGDSSNITIFGESAGSSSVIFQTLYPGNRGLFKRAIAESGTVAAWAVLPFSGIYNNSLTFARAAGCPSQMHAELMTCLRQKSSQVIEKIAADFSMSGFPFPTWVPVYDNDFVIKEPARIFEDIRDDSQLFSSYHDIDLLIGWNNYDGMLYKNEWMKHFNVSKDGNLTVTRNQFENYYIPQFTAIALKGIPTQLSKDFVSQEYTNFDDPDNSDALIKTVADLSTDVLVAAPSVLTASTHTSNNSNTFVYRFRAKPVFRLIKLPDVLEGTDSANHVDELPYVFGGPLFW